MRAAWTFSARRSRSWPCSASSTASSASPRTAGSAAVRCRSLVGLAVGVVFFRREQRARRSADRRAAVRRRRRSVQRWPPTCSACSWCSARSCSSPSTCSWCSAWARWRPGLWMAPSGIVFALGSMAAPVLVRHFRPSTVIASGLLLAAVGFALLTQLAAAQSPWLLFAGMMVFCIGLAPDRRDHDRSRHGRRAAGAGGRRLGRSRRRASSSAARSASPCSAACLTAVYRGAAGRAATCRHFRRTRSRARATRSAALSMRRTTLPAEQAAQLLAAARAAFVYAFEVTSAVSAVCAVLAAIFAADAAAQCRPTRISARGCRVPAVCSRRCEGRHGRCRRCGTSTGLKR